MLIMLVLLGVLFVSSIQPMFMITSMIMIVLLYSYMIYISMGGYWFGYALIMVMLSGVLVVFTYMVSLLPNEMFENYNFVYVMGMIILLLSGYMMMIYSEKWGLVSLSLWMSYVSMFNIFMVSFLLSIMLMVVWMSYMSCGALRI